MTIEFEIEGLPKMTNGLRKHWRVIQRERATWKALVQNAVLLEQKRAARLSAPLTKAKVTLTRCSARQPDYDGLVSSFKGVLDGLVVAEVLLDDSPQVIKEQVYLWEFAKQRQGKIRVKVETL